MSIHTLAPERATPHWLFFAGLAPARTAASDDVVLCRSLDVYWGLEARRADGSPRQVFPREGPRDDGPALLGPIAVAGAQPGHVIEVQIETIVPGPYGWTFGGEIGFFNSELNRA